MIDAYAFVKEISDQAADDDVVVVDGGGTNVYVAYQTFQLRGTQRLLLSTGLCSMGSGLPESVGACFGSGRRRTLCLCGDGSLQLNIQELQTIAHHRLPVKIFVTNNSGYVSIRQTQDGFLGGRHAGSDAAGGMSLPDFVEIARAYGVRASRITDPSVLAAAVEATLAGDDPALCEIVAPANQEVAPRQGFDERPDGSFAPRPLEDMYPFLDREELASVMFVPPWDK